MHVLMKFSPLIWKLIDRMPQHFAMRTKRTILLVVEFLLRRVISDCHRHSCGVFLRSNFIGDWSLFLFLSYKCENFVDRRKWIHQENLSSRLFVDLVESHEKHHDIFFLINKIRICLLTSTFAITSASRYEIVEFFPYTLQLGEVVGIGFWYWVRFSNSRWSWKILGRFDCWNLSLRSFQICTA